MTKQDLNSIAEFNRIILNYKKMDKIIQGWRCPVCGKVYSPYVKECQNNLCGVKVTTGKPENYMLSLGYTD